MYSSAAHNSPIPTQNSPGLLPYVTGSLGVWTLMDYFGEPQGQPLHAWPHVSCDFGQFDIAGHPKPHAYWYSANWLQRFGADEPGRPALPFKTVARILDLPTAPGGAQPSTLGHEPSQMSVSTTHTNDADLDAGLDSSLDDHTNGDWSNSKYSSGEHRSQKQKSFSAVTTAPFADLYLDGVSQGVMPTTRNDRGEVQPTEWPQLTHHNQLITDFASPNCTGVSSFPVNATDVQCHDLHRASKGDASAAACAAACCAKGSSCNTWQIETSADNDCWIGAAREGVGKCGPPRQGAWVGGQRHTTPSPSPPPSPTPPPSYRNATLVAYSAHPLTANATVLATHTLFVPSSNTSAFKLLLTLDVPSVTTGTGSALVLDGRDTALVRCSIVDASANDALVASASDRISWRVVSGPGRLAGVANGNRSSHEWMKSSSVNAYLGLARGMFRVTHDCTSVGRSSCASIDVDGLRGPTVVKDSNCDTTTPIVVEVSAPGFDSATISIPVSVDTDKDGVMAVARATGSEFTNGFSYLDDFVG